MAKNICQYFAGTIDAGGIITIETYANFLILLSNTSTTKVKVSIGGQAFQDLPVGLSVELPRENEQSFSQLQFQNVTAGAIQIEFAISNGRVVNSSLVLSGSVTTNEAVSQFTSSNKVSVGTGATIISTADPTRKEIMLYNNDLTKTVWVGDGSVSATNKRGIPLAPDETLILRTSAAIYGIVSTATADISIVKTLT